jgi:two-component system response regulator ResD
MTEQPKLLIVDDDVHIRKLIRLYLRDSPFALYEAATGEEALELAGQHRFDVVLLDLILPYFGGFRVCRKLKKNAGPATPYVVLITGDDSDETRATAKEAGADLFMAKPFSGEAIYEVVMRAAEKRKAG